MITLSQRMTLLHATTLFAGLDEQALAAIAAQLKQRVFRPGQTIFYEGDQGDCCYLIVAGRVQVVRSLDTAREIILAESRPGDVFGEVALFGGQQRMATIRALEKTYVLELSREGLDAAIALHPQLMNGVVQTLLLYLQHVVGQLAHLQQQVMGGGDFLQVAAGQKLGQYQLEGVLGEGGMATVYRARDSETGQELALKVLSLELSHRPGFLERFRREAVIFSSLKHEHILPVYGFGERGGVTFIATKLIRGGTLAERLGRPLPPERCAAYLDQIAAALDYAHSRGLVHLDVKPSNVLVDEQDQCYLADFGIAALADIPGSPAVRPREIYGTPAYLSPEQVRGDLLTPASDIYSLGIVLFEMASGRLPFAGKSDRETTALHVQAPVPSIRELNPALPAVAELVLRRALAKRPANRFAHAGDLASAWWQATCLSPQDAPPRRRGPEADPTVEIRR